jgi:hypothetical protein
VRLCSRLASDWSGPCFHAGVGVARQTSGRYAAACSTSALLTTARSKRRGGLVAQQHPCARQRTPPRLASTRLLLRALRRSSSFEPRARAGSSPSKDCRTLGIMLLAVISGRVYGQHAGPLARELIHPRSVRFECPHNSGCERLQVLRPQLRRPTGSKLRSNCLGNVTATVG